MQISALGHSCVLIEFGSEQESTRILVDPWLSDHAVGDGMGRFPRVRYQAGDLGPIHAVYLTHAHSDHLDPYTLVRLWRELDTPPTLILPVSLSFLVPLFQEHLQDPDILLLWPHEPTQFRGVECLGFFDVGPEPTNEDDVMVLVLTHGSERVLIEADARLTLALPPLRAFVTELMQAPGIDSAVYLTTENELTGTLEGPKCASVEEREALAELAMDEMLEAVTELYEIPEPMEEMFEFESAPTLDLWRTEHLLRLVHGQGLTAPHELDARWHTMLFPVRIDDRVRAERAISESMGCAHHIDELAVGQTHTIVKGRVEGRAPMKAVDFVDQEGTRTFDAQTAFFPSLPWAPLRRDARDVTRQRARILTLLNERFLPYLFASRSPPVLHLLAANDGAYRIRVHFGAREGEQAWDYRLGYDVRGFLETAIEHEANEVYWANDLDDVLEGRCDEFTTFCRTQLPVESMRLWSCLATPLLHSDLVAKRVGLHFERAAAEHTPGSFVLPLYARE